MHTFLSSGRTVPVAFPLENCSVRLTFPAQVANSSRGTLVVTNRQIIVLKLIKIHQYITNIILCQYYVNKYVNKKLLKYCINFTNKDFYILD